MNEDEYVIKPIGVIRSELVNLEDAPLQRDAGAFEAWLELTTPVAQGLTGVTVGTELIVLTWLHRAQRDVRLVHPRRMLKAPLTGVFATRSPDRPNPIGLHQVSVLEVTTQSLKVAPMEAINGTPIIDIKPVIPRLDRRTSAKFRNFRAATEEDIPRIAELVYAAYGHYIERIGRIPRPMTEDYEEVIENRRVTVAESHGKIVGIIVLTINNEGFFIDNVAIDPHNRGKGLGKALLEFAEVEAQRAGFDSIHASMDENMIENQAFFSKLRYVEYHRRFQGEVALVYMRKLLE